MSQTAPLLVDHVSPARAIAPLSRVAADRRAVAAVRATACLASAVAAGVLAHAAPMNVMHSGDIATVTPFRHTAALRHRPG